MNHATSQSIKILIKKGPGRLFSLSCAPGTQARLFSLSAFLSFSLGAMCFVFAPSASADCDWPLLDVIEKSGSQTTTVRGVPFTSNFHSWSVPHYHVDQFRCETAIDIQARSWSFTLNSSQADESEWLLQPPVSDGSTPSRSTPITSIAQLRPMAALADRVSSLTALPANDETWRTLPALPSLPSH